MKQRATFLVLFILLSMIGLSGDILANFIAGIICSLMIAAWMIES